MNISRRKLRNMILKTVQNYKNTSDKIPKADMREIYDGIICCSEYAYARHLIRNCKKNIPDYYLNNLNSFISKEYLDKLSDETHRLLAERSRHFSAPVENASSVSINEDDQKMLDEREKMFEDHNETLTKEGFSDKSDDIATEVKDFNTTLNEFTSTSASILDYVNLKDSDDTYQKYLDIYNTILNEQMKDIVNGNKENYSKNARKFIKLKIVVLSDYKITKAEKQALLVIMNAQAPLFWNDMTKDEQDYFLKEDQGKYNTSAVDEWSKSNDIETSTDFNKTDDGNKSKNEYVASDKKDAEKHIGVTDEDETTKDEINKGRKVVFTPQKIKPTFEIREVVLPIEYTDDAINKKTQKK